MPEQPVHQDMQQAAQHRDTNTDPVEPVASGPDRRLWGADPDGEHGGGRRVSVPGFDQGGTLAWDGGDFVEVALDDGRRVKLQRHAITGLD